MQRSRRAKVRSKGAAKLNSSQLSNQENREPNMHDTQEEINAVFNAITQELLQASSSTTEAADLGLLTAEQDAKVSVYLVRPLVRLISDKDVKGSGYPPTLVRQSFIDFIERIITLDCKEPCLKPWCKLVDKTFEQLMKAELLSDQGTHAHALTEAVIDHLLQIYLLPGLSTNLQHRSAYMATQIFLITHGQYRIRSRTVKDRLREAIIDMLHQGSKQSLELFGVQLGWRVCSPSSSDPVYVNLMKVLNCSKYKEVRKLSLKLLRVPDFVKQRGGSLTAKEVQFKHALQQAFTLRVMDVEPEVRKLAYAKMKSVNLRIEDFESAEARMMLIKEGVVHQDERVKEACIEFLEASIVEEVTVVVDSNDMDFQAKQIREQASRRRRSSLIAKNSRRNSQSSNNEDSQDGKPYSVTKRVYHFGRLLKLIDIKQAFVSEYGAPLPFVIMSVFFAVVSRQKVQWSSDTSNPQIKQMLSDMKEQDPEVILGNYAEYLIQKFKVQAGCASTIRTTPFDNFEVDECELFYEEVLFLRVLYEFTRKSSTQRSPELVMKLESIVPDFSEYNTIFEFFSNLDPELETGSQHENRLILSEWVKMSLQLNFSDETTRNAICNLLFNLIGQVQDSFKDYEHLLHKRRQRLDAGRELPYDDVEMDEDQMQHRSITQDAYGVWNIEIRCFKEMGICKKNEEYLKPYSFESYIRDSDDVAVVAVLIAKKLYGEEGTNQFTLQMLQTISDLREPLEDKPQQEKAQEAAYATEQRGGFGLYTQLAEPVGHQEAAPQAVTFRELREKYKAKLDALVERMAEDEDDSDGHLQTQLPKLENLVAILEEINLKEKLVTKRSLNLCLILLKQARVSHKDQNIIDICETLISPALQNTGDIENLLLALESIGQICLIQKDLFETYSRIFFALLSDTLYSLQNQETLSESSLIEAIIALQSSIDGFIVHGPSEQTEELQALILQHYLFTSNKKLRQISVEGVCKLLFSIRNSDSLHFVKGEDAEMHQDVKSTSNEGTIWIISHLILQWFDKKFTWQRSLVSQALNMFFRHFVLFSEQKCEIVYQALIRVAFSIIHSKYEAGTGGKNAQKKQKRRFSEDEEYQPEGKKTQGEIELTKVCRDLDLMQISSTFILLLSNDYILQNSLAGKVQNRKNYAAEYLTSICWLNNHHFQKVAIVKEVVGQLVASLNVHELNDLQTCSTLHSELKKCNQRTLHGFPKINKFLDTLQKRIDELNNLVVEKIEGRLSQEQPEFSVDIEGLQRFFETQIEGKVVFQIGEDLEEHLGSCHDLEAEMSMHESMISSPAPGHPRSRSSRRGSQHSSHQASASQIKKRIYQSAISSNNVGQVLMEEIYEKEEGGSSSERPKKLVRFDEASVVRKPKMEQVEEISNSSVEENESKLGKQQALNHISRQAATGFLMSKAKRQRAGSISSSNSKTKGDCLIEELDKGHKIELRISKKRSISMHPAPISSGKQRIKADLTKSFEDADDALSADKLPEAEDSKEDSDSSIDLFDMVKKRHRQGRAAHIATNRPLNKSAQENLPKPSFAMPAKKITTRRRARALADQGNLMSVNSSESEEKEMSPAIRFSRSRKGRLQAARANEQIKKQQPFGPQSKSTGAAQLETRSRSRNRRR